MSLNVTASAGDCSWTASSNAGWATVTSGGSGMGSRSVVYNVAVNPSSTARSASLTLADKTITLSQAGASDTTPPVISSLAAQGITRNSATIVWTTNEAATSEIQYTRGNSLRTKTDNALVTKHSLVLSALQPGKPYVIRVRSRDAASNTGSAEYTFTTAR